MQPPDNLPRVDSPDRWLRYAQSDLAVARMQPSEDVLLETLCFHLQQAVEKALKAVLVHYKDAVPRTHNLELLIDRVGKHVAIPEVVLLTTELSDYAAVTRYPGNYEPVTDENLIDDLRKAEAVVLWAQSICGDDKHSV